jgi:hypothetical protein
MQHYKHYQVYTRAICSNGGWHAKAVVLSPGIKVTRQIKHFDTVRSVSKHEAEKFAFELCKLWIDTQMRTHH